MDADSVLDAWPLCPECQRPRMTRCPICGTAGCDFPRAHENFSAGAVPTLVQVEQSSGANGLEEESAAPPNAPDEQRLALICTTCDEPWLARFLRRCEWCGHDFGAGLPVDHTPGDRELPEPINARVWIVIGLIAASLAAVYAWFWYVARR